MADYSTRTILKRSRDQPNHPKGSHLSVWHKIKIVDVSFVFCVVQVKNARDNLNRTDVRCPTEIFLIQSVQVCIFGLFC